MKAHLRFLVLALLTNSLCVWGQQSGMLPSVDFSIGDFRNPGLVYAPFTRWWWPGGDVEPEEIRREMDLLAENHFGGVEIQSFALVYPTPRDRMRQIMSFDTERYYENLSVVMEEAIRLGMTVDLTHGSGWPASGSHISEAEENRSLQYGMAGIPDAGGQVAIPRPERQDSEYATLVGLLDAMVEEHRNGPRTIRDVSVIRASQPSDSVVEVSAGHAVDGYSRVLIALWSVPSQERNMLVAKPGAGNVLDHLDSAIVQKSYEHYFGESTGLDRYYGYPFRSIFNDSYEFKVDRHFTSDFIEVFRAGRGYDPLPWLPANIWFGYNNMYDNEHDTPEFRFGDEDWRLRYDYDLTVSDLIRTHLLRGSAHWAESRGLLHKTQPYGLPMDYMGAAGDASIPEVENMIFEGGSEGGLKMITSGAMLYGRPLVSAESGVHINRALLATPQKLRLTVDKLLSSGVNQIIWHGTPYRYSVNGRPWVPFYNSMIGTNFSSDLYEENHFWEETDMVNRYAQRAQYLMRFGQAEADVLVYYPFMEYPVDVANPEEILMFGYLPETEPVLDSREEGDSMQSRWMRSIWPVLNDLERRGITWAWVNDESLQQMSSDSRGHLHIRGKVYKGLVLYDLPYIPLETARRLLRQKRANKLIIGVLPTKQPSFKDYAKNDSKVKSMMRRLSTGRHVCRDAASWMVDRPVRIASGGEALRQSRRRLSDDGLIQMFWNTQQTDKEIHLETDARYVYLLDAEDGSVLMASRDVNGELIIVLPGLSSRFLYLSDNPLPDVNTPSGIVPDTAGTIVQAIPIEKWDLTAGKVSLHDIGLSDWRMLEPLRDSAEDGLYRAVFTLDRPLQDKRFRLDLGDVWYTAEVTVNGHPAGKRIWKPFSFDVTNLLCEGGNKVEIRVKVSDYNANVRRGRDGDEYFSSISESGRMACGMAGPVTLLCLDN